MQIIEGFNSTTLIPNKGDSEISKQMSKRFSHLIKTKKISLNVVAEDTSQESFEIPPQVYKMLLEIFAQVSEGKSVSLISNKSEFTSQEAADFLNVSRPFLIKLLEKSIIPYRKVGKHRRIEVNALLEYKNSTIKNREQVLEELAEQAQELQMGYKK